MLQDLESRENRPEDHLGQVVKQLSARMPAKKGVAQSAKVLVFVTLAVFLSVTVYLLINQQSSEPMDVSLAVINVEKPVAKTEPPPLVMAAKTPEEKVPEEKIIAVTNITVKNDQWLEKKSQLVTQLVTQPAVNDDIAIEEMLVAKQVPVAEKKRIAANEANKTLPVMLKKASGNNKLAGEAGVNAARQNLPAQHVVYKKASRVSKEQRFIQLMEDARTAYRTRSYSPAIDLLNQALLLRINNVAANELLAASLSKVGESNQAKIVLQRSIDNGVLSPGIASQLAVILVSEEKNDKALQVLNTQLVQAKNNADYQALMAAVQQRLGEHDQAIVSYMRALQLNRGSSVWWMGMAISLEKSDSSPEALQAYKEAKKTGALSDGLLAYVDGRISQLNSAANEFNE